MTEKQPTRPGSKAADREDRRFDQTYLGKNHAETVHRDYAAHFFRWGFVGRFVKTSDTVIDIGCGPEFPLAKILFQSGGFPKAEHMLGIDLNKIKAPNWGRLTIFDECDITSAAATKRINAFFKEREIEGANVVTCFEVVEHMDPTDALALVKKAYKHLVPGGALLLSTPIFDGHRARNHIHEFIIPELQELIEKAGFSVERRYGTFMNANAAKKAANPEEKKVLMALAEYYSWDVLSCFLAPLYPDVSRNNLWVCRKPE